MYNNKATVEIAFKFIFLEISIKIITYSYRNLKKKTIIKCKTCRRPANDSIILIIIVLINVCLICVTKNMGIKSATTLHL